MVDRTIKLFRRSCELSQTNFQNITPTISLTRDEAISLLISAIAMEELGLSHIINAEGEKLQYVLGTLPGVTAPEGSTDKTKEIAKSFGAKVYDFEWIDHFAAARNFSFSKATMDYIMWLDADDLLLPEDGNRLDELKKKLEPHYNTVTMPYHLGLDSSGNPTHVLRRNRLVKRACQFKWIGAVHEYLEVYGPVYHSHVCITHIKEKRHTDRNLRIYRSMQAKGEPFSPRDDRPRGEICYQLGEYFLQRNQVDLAIYWFNLAILSPVPQEAMGLRNTAMTTWMAHLQLAVCYAKQKKYRVAQLHNEMASQYVPDHPSVLHNRHYFQRGLEKHDDNQAELESSEINLNRSPG